VLSVKVVLKVVLYQRLQAHNSSLQVFTFYLSTLYSLLLSRQDMPGDGLEQPMS